MHHMHFWDHYLTHVLTQVVL